jgi:hypothetical protein
MLIRQDQVLPCLYMSRISAWTNRGFEGSAVKGGYCQGFTKSHSGSGPNRLQPQELKEYSDSYLISDYLRPILRSKCLVTQTTSNYLGLSRAWTFGGDPREDVSGCHPDFQSFILLSLYVYSLVLLSWLVYIIKPLYYYSSVLKSTSFSPDSFPQSSLSIPDLCCPSEIRTFRCYEGTVHKLRPSPFRICLQSPESVILLSEPNSNADHRKSPQTILDSDLWRKPQKECFRLLPGLLIFYTTFLLCSNIGLTSPISIYSQILVLCTSVLKSI